MIPSLSEQSTYTMLPSGSWLTQTWRLTGWTLWLSRRRLMSKILAIILLVGWLAVIGILLLALLTVSNAGSQGEPGAAGVDQQVAQLLTFPDNIPVIAGYTTYIGTILLCILAGALSGDEYSFGTQRLMLSRGVSRAQLIVSQVWALALLALILSGAMILLGIISGLTIGPLVGGVILSPTLAGVGPLLLVWLALALHLLAYALIALFLGTLGRSTAAGIAGSLGYIIFEAIALPILIGLALFLGGTTKAVLLFVYHALLGPNLAAVLTGTEGVLLNVDTSAGASTGPFTISPAQGLLISLLYCAVFSGLSYWIVRQRDVTH